MSTAHPRGGVCVCVCVSCLFAAQGLPLGQAMSPCLLPHPAQPVFAKLPGTFLRATVPFWGLSPSSWGWEEAVETPWNCHQELWGWKW